MFKSLLHYFMLVFNRLASVKVMNCVVLVYFLLLCQQSNGLKKDFAMPNYGNALSRALVEIIEKFYMERTKTLNIYHASIDHNDMNLNINLDTMNEVLYQVRSRIIVQLEGYQDFQITNRKRVYNIFFVDSYESFWNIFRLMSPFYFEYQGFYIIALTRYSDQQYETMMNIFQHLWAEYIINVNIIWLAPENDNEAIMYTYFPYTKFFCGKAYPILLNQFLFGKWLQQEQFFPEKVSNMHGCPLTVATVFSAPFMILSKDKAGNPVTDGIDGVLLRVLSQRMNFSINLQQVESQGTIHSNGTPSGAIKLVIENKANMTIGYISTTASRNLYMTSSYVYFTSNLKWITPPGRLFTSFEKLFKPFRNILWSCILILFILSFISIVVVRFQSRSVQDFVFGYKNNSPSLNLINIFFGGSLTKLPNRNFARFLLAMFMIYCLIIRSSYTGRYDLRLSFFIVIYFSRRSF